MVVEVLGDNTKEYLGVVNRDLWCHDAISAAFSWALLTLEFISYIVLGQFSHRPVWKS